MGNQMPASRRSKHDDGTSWLYIAAIILVLIIIASFFLYVELGSPPMGAVPQALGQLASARSGFGFKANTTMLMANNSSQCYLQLVSQCNNNEPSQFVCINQDYRAQAAAELKSLYENSTRACPEFMLSGHISCAVVDGYCTVTRSASGV